MRLHLQRFPSKPNQSICRIWNRPIAACMYPRTHAYRHHEPSREWCSRCIRKHNQSLCIQGTRYSRAGSSEPTRQRLLHRRRLLHWIVEAAQCFQLKLNHRRHPWSIFIYFLKNIVWSRLPKSYVAYLTAPPIDTSIIIFKASMARTLLFALSLFAERIATRRSSELIARCKGNAYCYNR